jgi:mono/diheme cytochrome c family protein
LRLKRDLKELLALAVLTVALPACRQDMHDQPRHEPLEASTLFADGRSSRPLIEGTVARGQLRDDRELYTGLDAEGQFVTNLPTPVTRELLERGQSRFNAFCSPCHGRRGDGGGMVVQRGFKQPQSFHQDRLRDTPTGYYYDVITRGFGEMSSYAAQLSPRDRWAIVAYIRALQVSRNVPVATLTEEERQQLEEMASTVPGAPETVDHE